MKYWPIITTFIGLFVLLLTPIGWDLLSALMSGEALSRNIAGGVLTVVMLVLLVVGLLESLMWWKIRSRPNFPPPPQTPISDQNKPE